MMRRLIAQIASIAALVTIGALTGRPQSLPAKKEAGVLLQNAAEAANLGTIDTPPFRLVAKLHYELGRRPFDGVYELFWASPDRYRENYKMGTATEIELALGNKLYILRNTPIPDLPLWRLRIVLRSIYHGFHPSRPRVDKVYSAQVGADNRACVESEENSVRMRACFDLTTKEAVSLSVTTKFPYGVSDSNKDFSGMELSDFVSFGPKRYPRRILRHQEDEKIEVELTTLDPVARFDDELFMPPAVAPAYDWCPQPESKGKISYDSMPRITARTSLNLVAYYVLVGTDGKAKKSAPMRPGGGFISDRIEEWIDAQKFPIHLCAGEPIQYEMVLEPPLVLPVNH